MTRQVLLLLLLLLLLFLLPMNFLLLLLLLLLLFQFTTACHQGIGTNPLHTPQDSGPRDDYQASAAHALALAVAVAHALEIALQVANVYFQVDLQDL